MPTSIQLQVYIHVRTYISACGVCGNELTFKICDSDELSLIMLETTLASLKSMSKCSMCACVRACEAYVCVHVRHMCVCAWCMCESEHKWRQPVTAILTAGHVLERPIQSE